MNEQHQSVWVALKRMFFINYYKVTTIPRSWRSWTVIVIAFALLVATPIINLTACGRHKLAGVLGLMTISGAVLAAYQKLRPEFGNPAFASAVEMNIEIAKVMDEVRTDLGGGDRNNLQRRLLEVIASYVRSLRHDHKGNKIFANLLVLDRSGKNVRVIARSHRLAGDENAHHPLEGMAVRHCFLMGETVEVGDIWVEFPKTDRTKRYRSILAIPLKSFHADNEEVKILGVLSVDSSEPYHFAKWASQLENLLLPCTSLLEQTLEGRPK